jgi:hypothetical protein
MMRRYLVALGILLTFVLIPTLSHAAARLVSVTPTDGGCVYGPTGSHIEAWDVEAGKTYTLTLDNVTECSGTTIYVAVLDSISGNTCTVATYVAPGTYSFSYMTPVTDCGTSLIKYCLTGACKVQTGYIAGRHDTGEYQSHLRTATFDAGCTNPVPCAPVPTLSQSWGKLKVIYR